MYWKTIAAALIASTALCTSAQAEDSESTAHVYFHGQLVATGCSFDATTREQMVDLHVHTTDFINRNQATPEESFSLKIVGCKLVADDDSAVGPAHGLPVNLVKLKFTDMYRETNDYGGQGLTGRDEQSPRGNFTQVGIFLKLFNEQIAFDSQGHSEYSFAGTDHYSNDQEELELKFTASMKHVSNIPAEAGDIYGNMTVEIDYL